MHSKSHGAHKSHLQHTTWWSYQSCSSHSPTHYCHCLITRGFHIYDPIFLCRTKTPTGTAALLPQSKYHASVPCQQGSWAVCCSPVLIANIGNIYVVQFRLTNSVDLTINITLSMVGIRNGFRTLLLLLLDDLYLLATQKTVRMITNSFFVNLWNAQYLTLGMCFILGPK